MYFLGRRYILIFPPFQARTVYPQVGRRPIRPTLHPWDSQHLDLILVSGESFCQVSHQEFIELNIILYKNMRVGIRLKESCCSDAICWYWQCRPTNLWVRNSHLISMLGQTFESDTEPDVQVWGRKTEDKSHVKFVNPLKYVTLNLSM